MGWVPVGKELLRLPGAVAPASHLLAGEEEKSQAEMVSDLVSHALGKRVLEPGTPLTAPAQTLTSTPSHPHVFLRGQISNQPHTKTPKHRE